MKIAKRFSVILATFVVLVGLSEIGARFWDPGMSLIDDAQGIVGRPLTPVSVAGVARRTSRRTMRRVVY